MSSVNLKRQKKLNAEMNEVMDDFDRFEYFFVEHWKQFVYVAIAIVVAVAVIFSIRAYNKQQRNTASAAFSQAASAEELTAALGKYGSFEAAAPARLRLATYYIDQKDFAKAREVLAEAAKADAPEVAWRAKLNLAAVAELEGKTDEAAAMYADFLNKESDPASGAYRVEAAVAAGRLYLKAGNKDAAKTALEAGRSLMMQPDYAASSQGFAMEITSLLSQADAAPAK